MKTSQVLGITAGTLLAAGVGYAVYFDYKRMNDPQFRKQLKKDSKRTHKAAKKQHDEEQKKVNEAVEKVIREVQQPGVLPASPTEREKFFMEQVSTGEALIAMGPANYIAAATAFFKAIKIYPSPVELIMIYQKATPEEVFDIIIKMVGKDAELGGASGSGASDPMAALAGLGGKPGAGLEGVDDDDPSPAAGAAAAGAAAGAAAAASATGGGPTASAPPSQASSQEWDTLSGASLGPNTGETQDSGTPAPVDVEPTVTSSSNENKPADIKIETPASSGAGESSSSSSSSAPFNFSNQGSFAPSPLFPTSPGGTTATKDAPDAPSTEAQATPSEALKQADEHARDAGV